MQTSLDLKGQRLIAKVRLNNYRYPRSGHKAGDYAIVIMNVIDILEGELSVENRDGKITIVGNMPKLEETSEYIFQGIADFDKTWGMQYQLENLRLNYDMHNEDDQRKFFSYFMTDRQVEMLFTSDSNPIDMLEQKNIGKLTQIKGIGPATAARMCARYEDCKDNGRAYIALKALDLTKRMIDKLVEHYGSAELVVQKIETNPYILIREVRGIGWKKADDFAKRQGMANNCKERVMAYAQYYLEQQAEVNGNSWVTIEDLLTNIKAECEPIELETVSLWIKEDMMGSSDFNKLYEKIVNKETIAEPYPMLYYDKSTRRAGLLRLRMVEKDISLNLKRLQEDDREFHFNKSECERIIKECEKEQGYEYTDEQIDAMWSVLNNNVSILTGPAGCVDCDTEFFNGSQWKKISDYCDDDKVLIYKPDGSAVLEKPSDYIKVPCDKLWLTKSKYGIDMCLSDEHQVYYLTSKHNLYHKSFKEVKEAHEKSSTGFSGRFLASFKFDGSGIDLTDEEIKVMLAVICDGSFSERYKKEPNMCRFHIKKERKKIELRKILTEANITWKEVSSAAEGYTDFYFKAPRKEKIFTDYWYNCSQHQLQIICDNILKWDGSVQGKRKTFAANNQENADFIQFAFSGCNLRASLYINDRSGQEYLTNGKIYTRKSVDRHISITSRNTVSIGGNHPGNPKVKISEYKTKDGYKYCFTVSSHMWIMRRGGNIIITGNSGKSTTLKPLIEIFKKHNLSVEQCALSGRASSLLSEYTGLTGKTIHRLLAYIPETNQFRYSARNQLPTDVIILDETSMVGGELFLMLIEAIKSGAKFIMLGDVRQLESIGLANILKDCITSGYIKTNILTKIHRQASMSGIISQSLIVSNGKSIVKNDFSGEEIRGELKDFKLISTFNTDLVQSMIIKEFKRLYLERRIPAEDIQVIVPMRTRGNVSCRALNEILQNIVNPGQSKKEVFMTYVENGSKYTVKYKPNDRIIVIKNNYHAEGLDGKDKQIFNGNLGTIKDISEDVMIVDIADVGEVVLPKDQWYDIQLAYAITVHKKQGDSVPYAIVGLDTSAYTLLSRELLYTAITRAKKFCTLVTTPKAANTASRTSRVRKKQTWLVDDLSQFLVQEGASDNGNLGN